MLENSQTLEFLNSILPLFLVVLGAAILLGVGLQVLRYFTSAKDKDTRLQEFLSDFPKTILGAAIIGVVTSGTLGKSVFDQITQNGVLGELQNNAGNDLNPQGGSYAVTNAQTLDVQSPEVEETQDLNSKVTNLNNGTGPNKYNQGVLQDNNAKDFLVWCYKNNIRSVDQLHSAHTKDDIKKEMQKYGVYDTNDDWVEKLMELQNQYVYGEELSGYYSGTMANTPC